MRRLHLLVAAALATALVTYAGSASAHCDTMDGPVVKAGQKALDTGDLDFARLWVKPEAEPELRAAFEQARRVRTLGKDARALADRYFFETLVRLHRAGEGEPFTGIKPAGTDVGPAIPAADRAIATGSLDGVSAMLADTIAAHLKERFAGVQATRRYGVHDIAAGRAYVEAYVAFVHYVEGAYEAATGAHGEAH